jgi:hypothetical protein
MGIFDILGAVGSLNQNGLFGRSSGRALREEINRDKNMENLLAAGAEKVARENLRGQVAQINPETYDFSVFATNWTPQNFTNRDLFLANLATFSTEQLDNDQFMLSLANLNLSRNELQLLAFSLKNKGVAYDAKNHKLSFAGGAFDIDYLEITAANLATSLDQNQMGLLERMNYVATDAQTTVGLVRARAKLSRNVPMMILNPVRGVKLPTGDYVAQKIATEGGAEQHFNIFISPDYQIDALYIFTPDVLAVMDQYGANFAYKLYDDELEIYAPGSALQNPAMIQGLVFCAANLAKQIQQQTVRYQDENATEFAQAHGQIATKGRRLSPKVGVGIGVGAAAAIYLFANFILPLILKIFR